MTKASKRKLVLKAAELIASGKEEYCCVALGYNEEISQDFQSFYSIYCGSSFFGVYSKKFNFPYLTDSERRKIRVLALLWFMEAGL